MTPNDTDARDIVTRCEDALKRRDMLLEHKLLQEAVREMRATRAERDALRERVAFIDAAGRVACGWEGYMSDNDDLAARIEAALMEREKEFYWDSVAGRSLTDKPLRVRYEEACALLRDALAALRERDARIAALEREIGLMSMDFQPEVSDDDER